MAYRYRLKVPSWHFTSRRRVLALSRENYELSQEVGGLLVTTAFASPYGLKRNQHFNELHPDVVCLQDIVNPAVPV
jgi:hypothetical protein